MTAPTSNSFACYRYPTQRIGLKQATSSRAGHRLLSRGLMARRRELLLGQGSSVRREEPEVPGHAGVVADTSTPVVQTPIMEFRCLGAGKATQPLRGRYFRDVGIR